MYVRADETGAIPDHLLRSALCHPLAELSCGSASHVSIIVKGTVVTIADDGQGWPVHRLPHGERLAEAMLSQLYACRDHKQHRDIAHTLCQVTLPVIVALSLEFIFTTHRDGERWEQTYRDGVAEAPLVSLGASDAIGTSLSFRLDSQFCGEIIYSEPAFSSWLTTLPPNIPTASITFHQS